MRSYGDMVKEMHWPAVSKKKQLEMKLLMQSNNHPHGATLNKSDIGSNRGGNRRSAESLSGYTKTDKDDENSINTTTKRKKKMWKENPMVPKTIPRKEVNVQDWLQERRITRTEQELDGTRSSPLRNWQKDIEDAKYNQTERYEFIKERTKRLEEDAKRKEKMMSVANAGTMQDRDQINDMIFESIKAKLNVLEEFNT